MADIFAKDIKLPALASKKTRNMLFLAAHCGKTGMDTYQAMNERGLTPQVTENIKAWKQKRGNYATVDYHHSKVNVSSEEWTAIASCVKCTDDKHTESLEAMLRKEPIIAEIIPHLRQKDNLSAESLSTLYLALFQPSLESLLVSNLPKERNDVKRKIYEIRESEKYKALKLNPALLEEIFKNVQ